MTDQSGRPIVAPGIGNIIAVASGKGGVGKSTLAVNLAVALAKQGQAVGVLDADIYGPSIPRMLNLKDAQPETTEDQYFVPLEAHGLKLMSMGFLVPEREAMVWRGPMVQKALVQMLRDVKWGTLDTLIIDLPPGTGDVQLTLAQKVPLSGAVIVSTPQYIAIIDARKAVNMFQKTGVPILGIIENMSHYTCPGCGDEAHIFGHGGAATEAENLGVPYLGAVPLTLKLRQAMDSGTPLPEEFEDIAKAMTANLPRYAKRA